MTEDYDKLKRLQSRIRQALKKAGINQSELSRRVGVSTVAVSRWINDSFSVPLKRLPQIAEVTGVSHEWLLHGDKDENGSEGAGGEETIHEPTPSSHSHTHTHSHSLARAQPSPRLTQESSINTHGIQRTIAYQGRRGAYSHLACQDRFPQFEPKSYESFDDCFSAVENGEVGLAMIPIENSLGGRVADIHLILPHSGLYIVDEHFQDVRHTLWGLPGTELAHIKKIMSHPQAIAQCRATIRAIGAKPIETSDTAGACKNIADTGDKSIAALASPLAGEVYGLQSLRRNMEDKLGNVTRFIVMSRVRLEPDILDGDSVTSFIFTLRSIPAALYKCLGGFATNTINFLKLESYISIADPESASFYAEIQGHPADKAVERAFQELHYFTAKVKILGTFPANPKRQATGARGR